MAPFRFRYQSLLEHRLRQEDQVQCELARLLRQQMILQTQWRQLAQPGRAQHDRHRHTLALRIRLAELDQQIPPARERLVAAVRARRALELLRDREHARWQQAQRRREASLLDQQAADRFNQRFLAPTL